MKKKTKIIIACALASALAVAGIVTALCLTLGKKDKPCEQHNFAQSVTEPTCTQEGYTTYTCTVCDYSFRGNVKAALGHDIIEYVDDTATCLEPGTKQPICSRGDVVADRVVSSALGHSFVKYEDDHNASCEKDGTETAKCERCDATHTRDIAGTRLDHDFGADGRCTMCHEKKSTDGLTFRLNDDGESYAVSGTDAGYNSDTEKLVIPSSHRAPDGKIYPVTTIDKWAFRNKNFLSVTLPKTIRSIGAGAFSECNNLASVYVYALEPWFSIEFEDEYSNPISHPVGGIVSSARKLYIDADGSEILNVTEIEVPKTVTRINSYAFKDLVGLRKVVLHDNITSIGKYAFHNCSNLQYTVYENARYIGSAVNPYLALIGMDDLTKSEAAIHDDTKFIFESAFSGSKITKIRIPSNVVSVGDWAFNGCTELTDVGAIPNTVTSIGNSAFAGCVKLTNIGLPNGLKEISDGMFRDCAMLDAIDIPVSVGRIGENAFSGCANLKAIKIPDMVASIGKNAFENSGIEKAEIGSGFRKIEERAFSQCRQLKVVVINSHITNIEKYAFFECMKITEVYFVGTAEEWAKILANPGAHNGQIYAATPYYYSEKQPTGSGNYWHYEGGEVVKWN